MAVGQSFRIKSDDPLDFGAWVRHRCRIGGDKVALDIDGKLRTYVELDHVTNQTAAGLAGLGLKQGEHVALMMLNSLSNVDAWFGIQKAGLVEVPIHTASRGTGCTTSLIMPMRGHW